MLGLGMYRIGGLALGSLAVLGVVGCAAAEEAAVAPEPIPAEEFISGTWTCVNTGGFGAREDYAVEIVADDRVLQIGEVGGPSALYTYEVVADGIETSPPGGFGWKIESPIEVTPGEDFRVFIDSLGGDWAQAENPFIRFDGPSTVIVDNFWGYILRCDVVRD